MDKYEQIIFFNDKVEYWINVVDGKKSYLAEFDKKDNKLVINQEEDINFVKYQLVILFKPNFNPIEKISFFKNEKWINAEQLDGEDIEKLAPPSVTIDKGARSMNADSNYHNPSGSKTMLDTTYFKSKFESDYSFFLIEFDFNDRIDVIKFAYKINIVPPIEISIEYKEANKERYYKKIAYKKQQELLKKMALSCRTGDSLVNVYWQKASDDVRKIIFELFLDNKQLIIKNELDTDTLYKSVINLAYGKYTVVLSQFDSEEKVIISDSKDFSLSPPTLQKIVHSIRDW